MDALTNAILRFLGTMAQDASLSPDQREQATYIAISFLTHRHSCRIMAQVTALVRGEVIIHPSHRINTLVEDADMPVRRHGRFLQPLINDYRVTPTLADLEGSPIELISILDRAIESSLRGEQRLQLHRALLDAEKKANDDLTRITKKYGYHYIFRAGLQEYYMTKTVVEKVNFWRPDARGDGYRANAQKLCYEAIEKRLSLNAAEKNILVQAANCAAEDAYKFWGWLERNRISYNAMKSCLQLLANLERD